jgi:hypothetical protein
LIFKIFIQTMHLLTPIFAISRVKDGSLC